MEEGPGWHRVSPDQASLHRVEVGRCRVAVQGQGWGSWKASHRGLLQEAVIEVEEGLLGLLGTQRAQQVRV